MERKDMTQNIVNNKWRMDGNCIRSHKNSFDFSAFLVSKDESRKFLHVAGDKLQSQELLANVKRNLSSGVKQMVPPL